MKDINGILKVTQDKEATKLKENKDGDHIEEVETLVLQGYLSGGVEVKLILAGTVHDMQNVVGQAHIREELNFKLTEANDNLDSFVDEEETKDEPEEPQEEPSIMPPEEEKKSLLEKRAVKDDPEVLGEIKATLVSKEDADPEGAVLKVASIEDDTGLHIVKDLKDEFALCGGAMTEGLGQVNYGGVDPDEPEGWCPDCHKVLQVLLETERTEDRLRGNIEEGLDKIKEGTITHDCKFSHPHEGGCVCLHCGKPYESESEYCGAADPSNEKEPITDEPPKRGSRLQKKGSQEGEIWTKGDGANFHDFELLEGEVDSKKKNLIAKCAKCGVYVSATREEWESDPSVVGCVCEDTD